MKEIYLGDTTAKHDYAVETYQAGTIYISANTRSQAIFIANKNGYSVRSINRQS